MIKITKGFSHALKGGVNQTGMISAGMNKLMGNHCVECGKLLDNPQDPTSKAIGRHCTTCAETHVQERKASNG